MEPSAIYYSGAVWAVATGACLEPITHTPADGAPLRLQVHKARLGSVVVSATTLPSRRDVGGRGFEPGPGHLEKKCLGAAWAGRSLET